MKSIKCSLLASTILQANAFIPSAIRKTNTLSFASVPRNVGDHSKYEPIHAIRLDQVEDLESQTEIIDRSNSKAKSDDSSNKSKKEMRHLELVAELKVEPDMETMVERPAERSVEMIMEKRVEEEVTIGNLDRHEHAHDHDHDHDHDHNWQDVEGKYEASPTSITQKRKEDEDEDKAVELCIEKGVERRVEIERGLMVEDTINTQEVELGSSVQNTATEKNSSFSSTKGIETSSMGVVDGGAIYQAASVSKAPPLTKEQKEQAAMDILLRAETEAKLNELAEKTVEKIVERVAEEAAEISAENIVSQMSFDTGIGITLEAEVEAEAARTNDHDETSVKKACNDNVAPSSRNLTGIKVDRSIDSTRTNDVSEGGHDAELEHAIIAKDLQEVGNEESLNSNMTAIDTSDSKVFPLEKTSTSGHNNMNTLNQNIKLEDSTSNQEDSIDFMEDTDIHTSTSGGDAVKDEMVIEGGPIASTLDSEKIDNIAGSSESMLKIPAEIDTKVKQKKSISSRIEEKDTLDSEKIDISSESIVKKPVAIDAKANNQKLTSNKAEGKDKLPSKRAFVTPQRSAETVDNIKRLLDKANKQNQGREQNATQIKEVVTDSKVVAKVKSNDIKSHSPIKKQIITVQSNDTDIKKSADVDTRTQPQSKQIDDPAKVIKSKLQLIKPISKYDDVQTAAAKALLIAKSYAKEVDSMEVVVNKELTQACKSIDIESTTLQSQSLPVQAAMPSDSPSSSESSEKVNRKVKSKKGGPQKLPSSKRTVSLATGHSDKKETRDRKTTESKSAAAAAFQPLSSLMKAALAILLPEDNISPPEEEVVTEITNEAEVLAKDQRRSTKTKTETDKETEVLSRLANAIHEKKVTKAAKKVEGPLKQQKAIKKDKTRSTKKEFKTKNEKETEVLPSLANTMKKGRNKSNTRGKGNVREDKEDEDLSEKYAKIECLEDRAYAILVDLGMVEEHPDPDSPDYDDSK